MANNDEKWYFTKEQLENSPSRKCGIDALKELQYRQQAANFIQDMGQRLKVTQLCINTGIVYMHRFYVFHSFTHFPWQSIASAALFLAAKVEEQPRKLEHVIKVAHLCKNHNSHANFDTNSERYQSLSQDLVFNENILLQTLGFDVAIDHPHTHVVKCCHLVRASKDLAQTSYFLASNSLHLTTMCLQYRPTVVACFCILLACKWSNWEIPLSNEQKEWFSYIDSTVTSDLLQQLCLDFLEIYDRCPSRLKEKVMIMQTQDNEKKNVPTGDSKDGHGHRSHHSDKMGHMDDLHKHRSRPHDPNSSSSSQQQREREHREKKDRERMAQHAKQSLSSQSSSGKQMPPHGHHRPLPDQKMKQHPRPPSMGGNSSSNRLSDPTRDILRETASKDLRDYQRFSLGRDPSDSNMRDCLSKEMNREMALQRNEKDMPKRDYLMKPSVSESSNVNSYPDNRAMYGSADKPIDPSRSRPMDPTKYPPKHESTRRHEDKQQPTFPKTDMSDMNKKHFSASAYDKNNAFTNKTMNSTSHKMKSPYDPEVMKNYNNKQMMPGYSNMKLDSQNGNNSGYAPPGMDTRMRPEPLMEVKEELSFYQQMPPAVKKPSLFSPEKSPPKKLQTPPMHNGPNMSMKMSHSQNIPESPLSIFDPVDSMKQPKREQELRPLTKKIDQMEGFENLMTESSIGLKLPAIPDIITPIPDVKIEKQEDTQISKELKPPDIILPFNTPQATAPIVNSIETNPTLISNLLKEAPAIGVPTIAPPLEPVQVQEKQAEEKEKDREHHHKSKKKNKEKHKHKDKDRSRDEKKKKHKDKDKEKHKKKSPDPIAQPIKITISKDKIQQPPETPPSVPGLKIKIPKDRLKNDIVEPPPLPATPGGGLKIKIPKDVIKNNSFGGESRKRDREKEKISPEAPPSKVQKSGYGRMSDSKQNGRHSYNKVSKFNNGNMRKNQFGSNVNCSIPPPMPQQPYFYNFPPHSMQVPPPNMPMNPPMNMPPAYMYDPQMYSSMYTGGYMYPPPNMYQQAPAGNDMPPPLPEEEFQPDVPPPPPPE